MTTDNTQAELRKEIDVIVGNPLNRTRDTDEIMQLITAYTNKQTNEAIYGFHGFVMEADIIRPEADQSFNYGRLHRAIDDYIAERKKLNKSNGDVR